MSFLKKLFGGGGAASAGPAAREDYKGYVIEATPYAAEGQFQVSGLITKLGTSENEGPPKTHKFVRADRFASREEAATFSLLKARQIIDQMGDRMFQG
jgi:hypothetical protein